MNYIKHLPLALFVSYCVKYLVISPSYSEITLLGILGSISFLFTYFNNSKEIKELNDKLTLYSKEVESNNKEMKDIKSGIAGMRIAQPFKVNKLG